MPRLPVLIRHNRVFELVTQGRSYEQISKQLGISEDTIARDMAAISVEVQALARERLGEVLAVALATYQAVIDHAWQEYRQDMQRERDYYAGRLDYIHEHVETKSLALEPPSADDGKPSKAGALEKLARATLPISDESQPIEVKRVLRPTRPGLQTNRAQWLKLIVEATREFTELCGIKKLSVEVTGKNGGPIEGVQMTLDEWKQQAAARLAAATATLTLLDDAAPDV